MHDPEETIEFKADRPFIYMIRDNQTGTILFIGRYTNHKIFMIRCCLGDVSSKILAATVQYL